MWLGVPGRRWPLAASWAPKWATRPQSRGQTGRAGQYGPGRFWSWPTQPSPKSGPDGWHHAENRLRARLAPAGNLAVTSPGHGHYPPDRSDGLRGVRAWLGHNRDRPGPHAARRRHRGPIARRDHRTSPGPVPAPVCRGPRRTGPESGHGRQIRSTSQDPVFLNAGTRHEPAYYPIGTSGRSVTAGPGMACRSETRRGRGSRYHGDVYATAVSRVPTSR